MTVELSPLQNIQLSGVNAQLGFSRSNFLPAGRASLWRAVGHGGAYIMQPMTRMRET